MSGFVLGQPEVESEVYNVVMTGGYVVLPEARYKQALVKLRAGSVGELRLRPVGGGGGYLTVSGDSAGLELKTVENFVGNLRSWEAQGTATEVLEVHVLKP